MRLSGLALDPDPNCELTELAAAIERDFPEDADALALLGSIYKAWGRMDRAEACWQRSLELDGHRADVLDELGWAAFQREDYPRAEECLRRATELAPDRAGAFHRLGAAMLYQGRASEAVAPLRRRLALEPTAAETHYLLGRTWAQLEQFDLAARSYQVALKLRPNHKFALYGLAVALDRLGDAPRAAEAMARYRRLQEASLRRQRQRPRDDTAAMRRLLARALAQAAGLYAARGRGAEAESQLARAARLDPAREEEYRRAMQAVRREGHRP